MSVERGTWNAERPLVCFAVKEEAAAFKETAAESTGVEILVTGMGEKNSAYAVRQALETLKPKFVLTCGFAGALKPELKVGDVLFEADMDSGLGEILRTSGALPATFHCATRVAVTAGEKTALWRTTSADAVEMESAVIRAICREKKIPSATVRVVSDVANEDLPLDFNAMMTTDQKISLPRLALALMKSPGSVPRLLALQRNARFAAQRLAEVLNALLHSVRGDRV